MSETASWYQLKITLNDVQPEVWRRIVVDSAILLPDFHKVIQTVMGWSNAHFHQFMAYNTIFALPDEDPYLEIRDYRTIPLQELLDEVGGTILYEYDFGDGWTHDIVLEAILTDPPSIHPVCLEGMRNCPPEDCGGPVGYEDILDVISDPECDPYEETMDWLGVKFDPEFFSADQVNALLGTEEYGCITYDFP